MLAAALRKAGKPHELFIMEDEGHGIFHETNRLEYYRRLEAFFARHLGRRVSARAQEAAPE